MIGEALGFITTQLGIYLESQPGNSQHPEENAVLDNVSQIGTGEVSGIGSNVVVTLVNIEEDRISRPVDNYAKNKQAQPFGQGIVYKNPPVYLNLYVLFTACHGDYASSLSQVSNVIRFFQYKNVFTKLNTPDLPDGIGELIFDLKTLTLQDLNNLWGILGSKYLPSVMYKVRLVKISEDFEQGIVSTINEIVVNDQNN